VFGGQELAGGEIFSIKHPNWGYRAYRIGEIDSVDTTTDPNSITYSVAIRPPLREAVLGGEDAAFDRPRCLMKLPAGATMPWSVSGYWRTQQNVTLVEAF
jgi:hypothetical protein